MCIRDRSYVQAIILKSNFENIEIVCNDKITALVRAQSFERAITNLLSNAVKYGTHCRVSVNEDSQNTYFKIEDDGPGIPLEQREEAMKVFQRLDTARNQNIEGVGLGLSITRDITQMHGGSLSLDESDMGGLKAVIRLPR